VGKNLGKTVIVAAWDKGFAALETCLKIDMLSSCDQSDDIDDYRMSIDSRVFAPAPRSKASSATQELGLSLSSAGKKTACGCCGRVQIGWYDRKIRRVRDKSCGDARIYLDLEIRRVDCRSCGAVKQEKRSFLADNPFYTKRFAYYVGRRCRSSTIKDVAKELRLDWSTVKALDLVRRSEYARLPGTDWRHQRAKIHVAVEPGEPHQRDDRTALGRDRGLLRAKEQGGARIRGRF
jgi:hypothetical protein